MKYLFPVTIAFVALTGFVTIAGKTDKITSNYLLLKDRLIVSDSMAAQQYAFTLSQELSKMSIPKTKSATDTLDKVKTAAVEIAQAIAATHNINRQRARFSDLSERVWLLVAAEKKQAYSLYKQQCPMTGVVWISRDTAIKNPYYPKNMLTCGKVIEVAASK